MNTSALMSVDYRWVFDGFGVAIPVALTGWFVAWYVARRRKEIRSAGLTSLAAAGKRAQANVISVGADAHLVGSPVAVGNHNTQHVTVNVAAESTYTTFANRTPTLPTPNEIMKRKSQLPLLKQGDFLNGHIGMRVKWPLELWSISGRTAGACALAFDYADEAGETCVVCEVQMRPIVETLLKGQRAWIEGEISGTDHGGTAIQVKPEKLEFE
jgi:hypothetical protein